MATHTATTPLPDLRARLGWVAGVAGPVLFAACFLLQNLLRDDDDLVSEPVSALGTGDLAWIQHANFVVFGALLMVFAAGLHRELGQRTSGALGSGLLGLAGLGPILAAIVPLARDAAGEVYDPGGHFLAGVTFFAGSALALVVLAARFRGDPAWRGLAAYTLVAGLLAIVGFVVLGRFAVPEDAPLHAYAGVLQRAVLLIVTLPCQVAIALRLRRVHES